MHALFATALLVAIATSAEQPRVLIADIALSEFTPPLRLTLDVDSGIYSTVLPDGTWPSAYPQPQPRQGVLAGDRLVAVRQAYDKAARAGLEVVDCAARKRRPQDIILSNAPVPFMTIQGDGLKRVAPSEWTCFTPEALALQNSVDGL